LIFLEEGEHIVNDETVFQIKNSIQDIGVLSHLLTLTDNELTTATKIRLTPYILQLITNDKSCAIRRQFIPFAGCAQREFSDDYLREECFTPIKNLVHKYPNKAIYIATNQCACYCQFCTRQRIIQSNAPYQENLHEVIRYLRAHEEINDLLVTGGDPLMLETERLTDILDAISDLKHIKVLRIGTRIPLTMPMRVDSCLIDALKQYSNLYVNIHVNHISELTGPSKNALLRLANAGIPLGSQTVLLRGVNDDKDTLKELFEELVSIKVKPYYLYQCDKVKGCEPYVADIKKGIDIINDLSHTMSGFAVPKFVVDTPEFGKLVLAPSAKISGPGDYLIITSSCGICKYENKSLSGAKECELG